MSSPQGKRTKKGAAYRFPQRGATGGSLGGSDWMKGTHCFSPDPTFSGSSGLLRQCAVQCFIPCCKHQNICGSGSTGGFSHLYKGGITCLATLSRTGASMGPYSPPRPSCPRPGP